MYSEFMMHGQKNIKLSTICSPPGRRRIQQLNHWNNQRA